VALLFTTKMQIRDQTVSLMSIGSCIRLPTTQTTFKYLSLGNRSRLRLRASFADFCVTCHVECVTTKSECIHFLNAFAGTGFGKQLRRSSLKFRLIRYRFNRVHKVRNSHSTNPPVCRRIRISTSPAILLIALPVRPGYCYYMSLIQA
jgi:hypothetical protein